MQSTLQSLVDLLISAVPTMLFLIFLTAYLNAMLFKPIARILDERKKATEAVRELAQRAYEAADQKTSEYQSALDNARARIHQEQETSLRQWSEEQAAAIAKVRSEAELQIEAAKQQIACDLEREQTALANTAHSLSDSVVAALLQGRAA